MSTVTSRVGVIDWAKRKLGYPLVDVNVHVDQCDDIVDEAIAFFRDYYFDGIEKVYLKHQITATDIANQYITLPDLIFGVNRVFPGSAGAGGQPNIFDTEYQIRMNDLRDITSTSMIYYAQVMQHIALLDNMLNTAKQYRWNKLTNKLYIDENWAAKEIEGNYIVLDCYRALDPAEAPKFWDDRLFKQYVVALMKQQWGQNLKKYSGITLPGGIALDGQSIYDEGKADKEDIEDNIMNKLAPLEFMMG